MSRWDQYFIDVSLRTAQLSYAKRLKVGTVAVRDRRIICVGFNGTLPGESNVCESDDGSYTLPSVIHAEDNLFRFAKENGINVSGCVLYVTHSPCVHCAQKILLNSIKEVVYKDDYRSSDGIELLIENKIKIRKL